MKSYISYRQWLSVVLVSAIFSSAHSNAGPFDKIVSEPIETFGYKGVEAVDPRSGSLTIRHVDIHIPGPNGLDMEISRTYNTSTLSAGLEQTYRQSYNWVALGPGWSLRAAPRIVHGNLFKNYTQRPPFKQSYDKSPVGGGLCAGVPVSTLSPAGIFLQLPDGSQEQVFSSGGNKGITKNNWRVSCIEGLLSANSPEGIVYDFGSWEVNRQGGLESTSDVYVDDGYDVPVEEPVKLSVTYIDAKRATDPYGNWIAYEYLSILGNVAPLNIPGVMYGPKFYRAADTQFERANVLSKMTSSDGRILTLSYTADTSRLQEITDGAGRTWRYSYLIPDSENSRVLSRVTLPTGDSWQYKYQPGAFLYGYDANTPIDPLTPQNVASRKIIEIIYPTGGSVSYTYGATVITNNLLAGPTGNRTGYPMRIWREHIATRSLSTGGTWSYSYSRGETGAFDVSTVSGPEGVTTYKFMGSGYAIKNDIDGSLPPLPYENNAWKVGLLLELTRPGGRHESFVWKPREIDSGWFVLIDGGLVTDEKVWAADLQQRTVLQDAATYITRYDDHDAYGNPGTKTETGPNGGSRVTSLTYFNDPTKWIIGRLQNEVFPDHSVTRTFDSNGKVLSLNQNGVTTQYAYDGQGNLISETRPGDRIYTYSNYKLGVSQAEVRPEAVTITRSVDNAGNVTSETDGEGQTTQYTFDGLNRVTNMLPASGNTHTIAYTSTSKTKTRGALVEVTQYDPFGRVSSVTTGGITTSYIYDAHGRVTFTSNPGEATGTHYLYDPLGRLIRITHTDSSFQTTNYGAGSRSVTGETGKVTTFTYRSYGEPDVGYLMTVIAPDSAVNITLERNARDQITSVMQGGLTSVNAYNAHGYLVSFTRPETGLTTYGRDVAGNMTSRQVGASAITHLTYDGLNRLTSVTYPGNTPSVSHTYNKINKLLSSHSEGGNRNFVYDAVGNRVEDSLSVDGKVFSVKYNYNANDQLASIIYPQSGRLVEYNPDVLGRPTSVLGYINKVEYWPSGLVKKINYANGATTRYEQSTRLWPSTFSVEKADGAEVFRDSTYTYDGIGNLLTIYDTVDANFNRTLGYDETNRLTSVDGPWGAGNIVYDGVGNLTRQTFGQQSLAYAYDANNRLTSTSGSRAGTYSYDVYGNVSSNGKSSYDYNNVPNLICINCSDEAAKVEYSYDGLNHRSATIKAGNKSYEMYDYGGKLLIEQSGEKLTEYFYLGAQRIAQQVSQ